jgi:hypothetical protein
MITSAGQLGEDGRGVYGTVQFFHTIASNGSFRRFGLSKLAARSHFSAALCHDD